MDYLNGKNNISHCGIDDVIKKISYRYILNNSPCEFYAMPSVKNIFLKAMPML